MPLKRIEKEILVEMGRFYYLEFWEDIIFEAFGELNKHLMLREILIKLVVVKLIPLLELSEGFLT